VALCALPPGVIIALETAGFPVFGGVAIRSGEGVVHLVECTPAMAEWCRAEATRVLADRDRAQVLLFTAELIEQLEAVDRDGARSVRHIGRPVARPVATASAGHAG
jgi:hypothetical protein